ncbi:MAG: hypothetical protein NTY80_02425 [candidate division SR1 bacterium]|nr:hypothetical protein [candidate division SR1 bacterium]
MTKKWQKKIDAMQPRLRQELLILVQDIIALRLSEYDSIPLQGASGVFRVRKGKVRIIFSKKGNLGEIQKIDFRGDAYKGL